MYMTSVAVVQNMIEISTSWGVFEKVSVFQDCYLSFRGNGD